MFDQHFDYCARAGQERSGVFFAEELAVFEKKLKILFFMMYYHGKNKIYVLVF